MPCAAIEIITVQCSSQQTLHKDSQCRLKMTWWPWNQDYQHQTTWSTSSGWSSCSTCHVWCDSSERSFSCRFSPPPSRPVAPWWQRAVWSQTFPQHTRKLCYSLVKHRICSFHELLNQYMREVDFGVIQWRKDILTLSKIAVFCKSSFFFPT